MNVYLAIATSNEYSEKFNITVNMMSVNTTDIIPILNRKVFKVRVFGRSFSRKIDSL